MTKVTGRPEIYWYPTASFYPDDATQEDVNRGTDDLKKQYRDHNIN